MIKRYFLILFIVILTSCSQSDFENKLLNTVTPWLGTPYKWGGTTKKGIDCSGFVQNVYASLGVNLPRCSAQQRKTGKGVNDIRYGDLVFFILPGNLSHVGIYLGEGKFVHSSKSKGVTVSSLDNNFWKKHLIAVRRVKHT